jgi:hypothetical protein
LRAAAITLGVLLAFGYLVALLTVEGRLEDMRRKDAPPMPGWNWGRFRYLTEPANLRPGAEPLIRRYKALWFIGPVLVVLAVVAYSTLA